MIVLVHSGVCDARMWDGFELPGAIADRLAAGIAGAERAPIAGGHLASLERPEETARLVREFLQR